MKASESKTFPALRAKMGDRWYYLTTMTFAEVARWVRPVDEIHERAEFKTWLQRMVREERKEQIADYLEGKSQRFFNSVVVGIYGGDPEWLPVAVDDRKKLGDIEIGVREATAFGVISISGNEDIFAIDGQHRVEGIREVLKRGNELSNEELSVIFVSHRMTDEGRERTRRLFTTLNKYAKPASKAELIALNDDDAFAISTRKLIDEYTGLQGAFVPLLPTANLSSGDTQSLTSIITLYDVIRVITVPKSRRERISLEEGPPETKKVTEVFCKAVGFWDALRRFVPEIAEVCASSPEDEVSGKFRNQNGGHLLFRPAGLLAFAKATRILLNRGFDIGDAVKALSRVESQISARPWCGVLWKESSKTVILKNSKLLVELLLWMSGERPSTQGYNVLQQYRKALGDEEARLPRRNK